MRLRLDLAFLSFCLVLWFALELVFIALGVKPAAFFVFTLFLLTSVFLPGYELLDRLPVTLTPFTHFSLAFIIGYPLSTFVYFLCRYFQVEWLYGVFLVGVISSFTFNSLPDFTTPTLRLKENGYFHSLLLGLYLIILLVCGYASFGNGLLTSDGSFRFASLFPLDFPYHIALVNELSNFFPPRIPAASQFPLVYHYFPNLFASLLVRWLNLNVWDVWCRFLPLVNFSCLVLSVILLCRELASKKTTVLTALVLVVLGSNGAIFAELMGFTNPPANSTLEFLFGSTFTVLHINPMINAIALFFAGCFALNRYQASKRKAWLLVTGLLFTGIAGYKIFLAAMLVCGLFVSALLFSEKTRSLPIHLVSLLLPLVLVILLQVYLAPFKGSYLKFEPGFLSVVTLTNGGIFQSRAEGTLMLNTAFFKRDYWYLLKFVLPWGLFWFFGSFFSRVVGLYHGKNFLFSPQENGVISLISWLCLIGIVLGTFFVVMPERINTSQFFTVSLIIAGFLTALFLESLTKREIRVLVTTVVLLLALPTSLTMLSRLDVDHLLPALTKSAAFLRENTPPDAVVAYPQDDWTYVFFMALSERRSMHLDGLYLKNLLGREVPRRLAADNRFLYYLRSGPPPRLNAKMRKRLREIIRHNRISYLVEDARQKTRLSEIYLKTVYNNRLIVIRKVEGISFLDELASMSDVTVLAN